MLIEVSVLDENDLKVFAAGEADAPLQEAIEAYLFHHPEAATRVDRYRREARHLRRIRRRQGEARP